MAARYLAGMFSGSNGGRWQSMVLVFYVNHPSAFELGRYASSVVLGTRSL